jgi:Zn-dependent peptidase ImmA (M78 family)/DNA-binding XRE family transcriptional regulator
MTSGGGAVAATHERIASARERSGYSQDDVAAALGVSRVMVSYWETGKKRPTEAQLELLSRLFGLELGELLGAVPRRRKPDVASMMFRAVTKAASPQARTGIEQFIAFLDSYAELSSLTGIPIQGMRQSPFVSRRDFNTAEDARRKAEEVRSHLRLALSPIPDLDAVCDMLGIAVVRLPLGEDLEVAPSGVFFAHPTVGFSIVVNLQMTPGRRRFTLAHELAHALFDSDEAPFVVSGIGRDARERFADAFAGELLMPSEAIRRLIEDEGIGRRITDVEDVVHIQRYFKVSYATALVRLRQARLIGEAEFEEFRQVRPVLLAEQLGYDSETEEYFQDPDRWRLGRYPPRFLRMLRSALRTGKLSVPTAASITELTHDEIEELVAGSMREGPGPHEKELDEHLLVGVLDDA